jgi:hypothetical protein
MKSLKEYITLVESEMKGITDDWFKDGGFKTFKLAKPIRYVTATDSGTVDTLEGPVKYVAGHKIITGPKGEKYPVSPESFEDKYDIDDENTATPKKIIKYAKLADHDGVLHTSWGDLEYTKGNDVIVRHGEGDYGAVKKEIFQQTYDTKEIE